MFNKERVKGLVSGALIGAVVAGTAGVFAYTDYIEAVYNDIKIVVDGQQITPDDGSGNKVEPFIYNGTTYLPVRAVANAFGKEADWDGSTNTVILGAKSFDWLDQIGYANYDDSHAPHSQISAIPSNTSATDGMKYSRGLEFYLSERNPWKYDDGTEDCYIDVTYNINNNYKSLSGTLCTLAPEKSDVCGPVLIKIYGDAKLLYTSPVMSSGTKSTPFEVDISNYKVLKLRVETASGNSNWLTVGIADARLSKK